MNNLTIENITNMLNDENIKIIDIANYVNVHRNLFKKADLSKIIVALSVYISFKDIADDKAQLKTILNTINVYL